MRLARGSASSMLVLCFGKRWKSLSTVMLMMDWLGRPYDCWLPIRSWLHYVLCALRSETRRE
jgi:hypothetical protein